MTDPEYFSEHLAYKRVAMRPTARTWAKHILLMLVTLATATVAGSIFPFGRIPFPAAEPNSWGELASFLLTFPALYLEFISSAVYYIFTVPGILRDGLSFSIPLLFILVSHEMGHYIACRIYGVDATLPYFIPTPPMIGPAGTFGAFIKIMSPMPSKRAVFDIGIAGPIAGFMALIPIAVIGITTMETVTPEQAARMQSMITFADPLLMRGIASVFGIDLQFGFGNPFYFAAWVGLLVTALNLIPSGQLDGGHAIYAVLGKAVHYWTGRAAFVFMAVFSIAGWYFYNSPSGFLIAVLLGVMMRVPHPEPWDQTPLDAKRKVIAALTLLIFILSFTPFPIRINY